MIHPTSHYLSLLSYAGLQGADIGREVGYPLGKLPVTKACPELNESDEVYYSIYKIFVGFSTRFLFALSWQ